MWCHRATCVDTAAATAGAVAGISREKLKACGGWTSNSVDLYVRMDKPGIDFSSKMLQRL